MSHRDVQAYDSRASQFGYQAASLDHPSIRCLASFPGGVGTGFVRQGAIGAYPSRQTVARLAP
jgi:hypothetical protein